MTTERNSLLPGSIGQVAYRERWEGTGGSPTPTYGGSARGGGERRWNSYNHIGNVVGISNASGYFVEAVDTDAFGNPLASTQTGEWASGLGGNRGLTTKELDPAAGLYYFYQRWYDPQTATFASRAPYPEHIEHSYSSSYQNPLSWKDARGTLPHAYPPPRSPKMERKTIPWYKPWQRADVCSVGAGTAAGLITGAALAGAKKGGYIGSVGGPLGIASGALAGGVIGTGIGLYACGDGCDDRDTWCHTSPIARRCSLHCVHERKLRMPQSRACFEECEARLSRDGADPAYPCPKKSLYIEDQ